jgi:hypothetical protein
MQQSNTIIGTPMYNSYKTFLYSLVQDTSDIFDSEKTEIKFDLWDNINSLAKVLLEVVDSKVGTQLEWDDYYGNIGELDNVTAQQSSQYGNEIGFFRAIQGLKNQPQNEFDMERVAGLV